MKRILLFVFVFILGANCARASSLYDQSIAEVLRNKFASSSLSFLLMDTPTEAVLAASWQDIDRPIAVGSLVKPFTALAYAASHGYRYPELTCRGSADGCWLPRGHGRIGIKEAVGYSCNAYFRQLAESFGREDIAQITHFYTLRAGPASFSSPRTLVGLGTEIEISPREITKAYIELASRTSEPAVAEVLRGMELSARAGTAGAIQKSLRGVAALAKTGTAPCVHSPRAPGDGFTIILYPADSPRWVLLVRMHGVPGATAARVGSEMLRTIVTGR